MMHAKIFEQRAETQFNSAQLSRSLLLWSALTLAVFIVGAFVISQLHQTTKAYSSDPVPSAPSTPSAETAPTPTAEANTNNTSVIVNGESVPVPANGTVDQTISSDGSNVSVKVYNQQHSSSGSNSSSLNVQVHSP